MNQDTPAKPVARFGPFEADLLAGELRRDGVKLRLVGQPLEILAILLERSGEVVTREELRTKLWPSDTFVDFDHGLNAAVSKLRSALGDSADVGSPMNHQATSCRVGRETVVGSISHQIEPATGRYGRCRRRADPQFE